MAVDLEDDGLCTPAVGSWSERKYSLLGTYTQMFATAMKNKWACRVYIDLFAGAGRARIGGTQRIVSTCASRALSVQDPFDRYLFCDIDAERMSALQARVDRDHPGHDVRCFVGDANVLVDSMLQEVPRGKPGAGVLALCVLDPYKLKALRFETIERLSSIFVDFLILIPSHMDANREQRVYARPENRTVEHFTGNPTWRAEWATAHVQFGTFIVDQLGKSMQRLGYIYNRPGDEVLVTLPQKKVKLYYLAAYSRHPLGSKFWREAKRTSSPQLKLL
jgi:three-Cys-motif partner protein